MLHDIEKSTREVLDEYPIRKAAFFGSVLEERFDEKSDVDIIIEFLPGTRGIEFFGLKLDLEERLKRPIDLMTFNALTKANSKFKNVVEREAYVFYERTDK